jgi:hypothetical protein
MDATEKSEGVPEADLDKRLNLLRYSKNAKDKSGD